MTCSVQDREVARLHKIIRQLISVIALLIILMVGMAAAFFVYEAQFSTVYTTEQTISATQDGSGQNIVGGGDIYFGSEG